MTYEENHGDIQHKGNDSVGHEGHQANVVDVAHGHLGDFKEKSGNTVHDSADGSKVVQRDEGVHLELSRAQQTLDHNQADGFKDDTTDLEHETNEDKLDFTKGRNDNADDNGGDVQENLEVDGSHSQSPSSQEHGNGCGGLEHLNESDTEIQVGNVSADQTQAEEEANGYNRTEVNAASHLDGLAAIKQVGGAGEDLSHEGCECQVPCCEEDG